MKPKWIVCLGEAEWGRFTHAGVADEGVQLLGSIRRGPQMGALALDEQGRYLQLNGDHRTELNQSQVAAACRRARHEPRTGPRAGFRRPGTTYQPVVGKPPATPPVVTVRKRKILEVV
jgi:hypothetical protein